MKFKTIVWTFAILLCVTAVGTAFGQGRTVTNGDLEKYRQKRLQAEKDYQENYARMGFPSPEELRKQVEKNRVEREALAARLTAERMEREQAEGVFVGQPSVYVVNSVQSQPYYFGNPYVYRRPFPAYRFGPTYRVGGGMVFPNNNVPPRRRPIFFNVP